MDNGLERQLSQAAAGFPDVEVINDPERDNMEKVVSLARPPTNTENPEARPAMFKNILHEFCCIVVLSLAPAMASLNNGGLIIALPEIGKEFNISGGTLGWTLAATSLATGSVLLFMGQVSDTFGRKKMVLMSYCWYAFMSLGAGLVRNPTGFFILRAMQGISSASAVTSAVGIIGAGYLPGKRKNHAMATFSAGAPTGFVVGLVAGGICTELINWHSVLYFYAIVYGVALVIGYFAIPPDKPLNWQDVKARCKTMDFGGITLTVSGFTLFIFALAQWDSAPGGWANSYIISCLVIGFTLIVCFIVYEGTVPKRPLMPLRLWRSWQFCLCMMIGACGWGCYTGVLTYYSTMYFQSLRGASAILTTAYFVPQAIAGILVNVFAGLVLHKIPGKFLLVIAMCGFFVSSLLWSFIGMHTSYWAMPFPAFICNVIGLDLAYNVCNMHTLSLVDKSLQSTAAGIFNTVIQLASAMALSVSNGIVSAMEPENATKEQILHAYKAAFKFALGLSSLGLLLSFFIRIGTQGGKEKEKVLVRDEESEEE